MEEISSEKSAAKRKTWAENICVLIVCLAMGLYYFWCATQPADAHVSAAPLGMYGLLTEGFQSGHTYLNVEPAPDLLKLPDPYDPTANARWRLHDATLYHGKYYLYFSPVAVLTLMMPWHLLFGNYLSEPMAVTIFLWGGFLGGAFLMLQMRRWLFPRIPFLAVIGGLLVLGAGNMANLLAQWVSFYHVPISCAYCFMMCALACLGQAAMKTEKTGRWLFLGSLLYGLAMCSRPDYVLGAALLLLPITVWLIWFRGDAAGLLHRRTWQILVCAFGPIGALGVGLLLYNYIRFHSFSDFGVKFQLAGASQLHLKVLDLKLFPENFRHYFSATAKFGPYFPFFVGGEQGLFGIAYGAPLAWLILLTPLALLTRQLAGRGAIAVILITIFLVASANFVMVSAYFLRVERYTVDYYPAFALLGVLAWLTLVSASSSRFGMRYVVMVAGLLGAASMVGLNLAMCAARFASPAKLEGLGRLANEPTAWIERRAGHELGAERLTLIFPTNASGRSEPLVTTGIWNSLADVFYVDYLKDDQIDLGFFHVGMGGPKSKTIKVVPGSTHTIEVSSGGLLPPPLHPVYNSWLPRSVDVARKTIRVTFDGELIINASEDSFNSRPADLYIGDSRWEYGFARKNFTGKIISSERKPLIESTYAEPKLPAASPLIFTVILPYELLWSNEPLLATGDDRGHDLIYAIFGAKVAGKGKISFSLNHLGSGGPTSREFDYDPLRPHTILLWMDNLIGGPASLPPEAKNWADRLLVMFDGKIALDAPQHFYSSKPDQVVFGLNPHKAGTAGPHFSGRLEKVSAPGLQALPNIDRNGSYGTVHLDLTFPEQPAFAVEPLVVTGVAGAGDFLYIHYTGLHQAQLGFDHWGTGGGEGASFPFVPGRIYHLDLTMGSLYEESVLAESGQEALRRKIEVKMDGTPVLSREGVTHRSLQKDIVIGKNEIGGSLCAAAFSGKILYISRTSRPEEDN